MNDPSCQLEVSAPGNVDHALAAMRAGDEHGQPWTPMAGGTDVCRQLNAGHAVGSRVLSLHGLRPELRFISLQNRRLRVGALTTLRDLAGASVLASRLPLLAEIARRIGTASIQTRATVGGNIAGAWPPGDTLPVWAALDAQVVMRSVNGRRQVPFDALFLGHRCIDRRPDELLVEVRADLPPRRARHALHKLAPTENPAATSLVFAGLIDYDRGKISYVRVALGSPVANPLRARATEALLVGEKPTPALIEQAVSTLSGELAPHDDERVTAACGMLRDLLRSS